MTKKKKIIIESIVLAVLIVYLILSQLCCGLFFKNKFSNGNISFYYNNIENYNLNSSDKKGLEEYFTELTEKIKTNPFYSEEKKLSFFICDNYGLYTFFSNINNKSMGITNNYGNHGFIILNKTDLSKKETITQSKENNTRSFESLVMQAPWYGIIADKEGYERARKDPAMVHYSGDERPWFSGNFNPWRQEYEKYLAMTPWAGTPKIRGKEFHLFLYHLMNLVTSVFPMVRVWISGRYYQNYKKRFESA